MNNEQAIGILLVTLLLGGLILFSRRSATSNHAMAHPQQYSNGNIRVVPMEAETRRYQNKETRRIEYNEDGLPSLIEITRDYAVT